MEGEDRKATAGIQKRMCTVDGLTKSFEFAVDLDAHRLEGSPCGMLCFVAALLRHGGADERCKFRCGLDGLFLPLSYDAVGDTRSKPFLPVFAEDAAELFEGVAVDHIARSQGGGSIHTHIKRCIRMIAESALGGIQLMRGYTKIE